MDNFGLKISLPGFDVVSASPEQCAVDSKYDTFKVDETASPPHFGEVQITFRNNPATNVVTNLFKIPHGYNHRPTVFSHIDIGVINNNIPGLVVAGRVSASPAASNLRDYLECVIDDTYMYINVRQSIADWTGAAAVAVSIAGAVYPNVATVRYYIFAEDGK